MYGTNEHELVRIEKTTCGCPKAKPELKPELKPEPKPEL